MSAIYDIAGTSNDTFMINGKATFIQGKENPKNYQGLDGDLYLQSGVEGDDRQNATVWIKTQGSWKDMANSALPVSSIDNKDKFLISKGDGSYDFASIKFVDGAIATDIPAGSEGNALYATMAGNDQFRIRLGGTSDRGWVELATSDNAQEPIYIRQYRPNFNREESEIINEVAILDDSGYTYLAKQPAASNLTASETDETKQYKALQAPTIGWVNDPTKSTNVVHRSGTETITGDKTFSSLITSSDIVPNANNTRSIGTNDKKYKDVYATSFNGTSTKALWADIAEYYEGDADYEKGTLVAFGGDKEVTIAKEDCNAVISSEPGVILNSESGFEHPCMLSLAGRVPVRVIGKVNKFDYLQLSEIPGVAAALPFEDDFNFSNVIARALENKESEEEGLVLCVVKFEL